MKAWQSASGDWIIVVEGEKKRFDTESEANNYWEKMTMADVAAIVEYESDMEGVIAQARAMMNEMLAIGTTADINGIDAEIDGESGTVVGGSTLTPVRAKELRAIGDVFNTWLSTTITNVTINGYTWTINKTPAQIIQERYVPPA